MPQGKNKAMLIQEHIQLEEIKFTEMLMEDLRSNLSEKQQCMVWVEHSVHLIYKLKDLCPGGW